MNSSEITSRSSHRPLQLAVLSIGVVVLAFIFFADKTYLNNQTNEGILGGITEPGGEKVNLPPLASEPETDRLIQGLADAKDSEKLRILDTLIVNLQIRKRFGHAAEYASQAIALDSSLQQYLRAGELSQQALDLPFIREDSTLANRFSQKSIAYLSRVLETEPENERAQLSLGLAYVNSGNPQYSMKGIQTLLQLLKTNPGHVKANYHLGLFSIQTRQYDKALSRFEQVLSSDPDHGWAEYQMAVVYMQQGDREKAKSLLETLVANTADDELKLSARQLLTNLGQ